MPNDSFRLLACPYPRGKLYVHLGAPTPDILIDAYSNMFGDQLETIEKALLMQYPDHQDEIKKGMTNEDMCPDLTDDTSIPLAGELYVFITDCESSGSITMRGGNLPAQE